MTKASFEVLRKGLFPVLKQSQVDALNYLVQKCEDYELTYPEAAYVLATVYHETGILKRNLLGRRYIFRSMQPVKERGSIKYLRSKKYYPYIGYGYVQLTWEDNYRRIGKLIGVDLIANPEKALEPDIAAEILIKGMVFGWFTGVGFHRKRPVSRYNRAQYIRARNIVNGSDKATLIAGYAMQFEKALRS
ncbi:putative chitinase-like endolysin [Vibrio phage vB_VhaP_VH-5]|uniref:Putative chitinase-like endolysin n=1 Tax=Vibrio phage vB_VhaP_VH-5 TaxID=2660694 RepID=A0A5Q2WCP4_9CAUD|nr:putative chitinase-like endolysin [Vibrio phage vB_VhaP_VH-5]